MRGAAAGSAEGSPATFACAFSAGFLAESFRVVLHGEEAAAALLAAAAAAKTTTAAAAAKGALVAPWLLPMPPPPPMPPMPPRIACGLTGSTRSATG